ncbi:hypothetical protein [Bartonella massiliensis]|uniref:hypothetical protein n=1 Tax=Bartonella massiliensis TaxID=929795 RepID=UPI00115B72D4|nr:hypothetical protein [Bartonella massiliensis]
MGVLMREWRKERCVWIGGGHKSWGDKMRKNSVKEWGVFVVPFETRRFDSAVILAMGNVEQGDFWIYKRIIWCAFA